MTRSVLEIEALSTLHRWKSAISRHDRAVVLGFVLSLPPLFPVALCGFLLSSLNYSLWKQGKLELFEEGLIKRGLLIGFINLWLGLLLLYVLFNFVLGLPWHVYPQWLTERLHDVFEWIYQLRTTKEVMAL